MKNKIFNCLLVVIGLCFNSFADKASLILENDCLFIHSDNDYTHGTGFEYVYNDLWHFRLQQNMYTPHDITIREHIPDDRPYCGWLGAEVGREMFKDSNSPWTHYLAVNFGMIGPASLAGQTQKFIHKVLNCRTPNGWDNQLHNEFCVNFQWWTKYNWFITDWLALIPRAGAFAGTIQDGVEIGTDLKIGYNLRKDVGNNMMFSATAVKSNSFLDNFSIYAFAGPDCRCYAYNHVLEGSMFNHKDDELGATIRPFVGELQFGAGIGVYDFFVRYYAVMRTNEFKHQRQRPDYGGLVIGYSF